MATPQLYLFILLMTGASHCAIQQGKEGPGPLTLVDMGTFEGKRYYRENVTTTTQLLAKTHCESEGMQLVSITSVTERAFIQAGLSGVGVAYHWTAAKATGAYYSIASPGSAVLSPTTSSDSFLTCLAINTNTFATQICSSEFYPLCFF